MKAITRGFLLGVTNEEGRNCSIRRNILYSYSSPLAWFNGQNSLSIDKDVVEFSKASKRLFNQLQRDMSLCGTTFTFVESGRNIVKEPIGTKTIVPLEPDVIESIDDLLKELKDSSTDNRDKYTCDSCRHITLSTKRLSHCTSCYKGVMSKGE